MADLRLTRPNSAISDTEEAFYRKRRSFTAGFTITSRQEVLLWPAASGGNGQYYQWKGSLPKAVPAGSTPATTGGVGNTGWVSVGTANYLPVINTNIATLGTRVTALEQNPNGKSAYEVAVDNGFQGTETQWLASLKGATGSGLNLLGSKGSISDLPTTGNKAGDAYIVSGQLYAWDGSQWAQVAQVGPTGKSAYQTWLDLGNTGDEAAFIASLKGLKGDAGPQGAKGEKGDPAATLLFQGTLSSAANLPAASTSNLNWTYIINLHAWVSTGTAWVDIGNIQGNQGEKGDKGDKGDTGDQGLRGEKGEQGEQGPGGEKGEKGDTGATGQGITIINKFDDPSQLPTQAETGDAYIVGDNLYVWLTGASSFTNVGTFRGPQGIQGEKGDKGDKGDTGDVGSQWFNGPGTPDGSLGRINDYYVDANTSEFYKKTDTGIWTYQGVLGILDAQDQVAGALYLRSEYTWKRLNRYDLNVETAMTTLDVSDCQVFTVDLSTDRTLNITNLLPARSMSVIIIFSGNIGEVTWSNTINWTDGIEPTYFTNRTVVSLLWDGSVLIGFKAGGY